MGLRILFRDVVDISAGLPNRRLPIDFGLAMENRNRPAPDLSASESFHFAMIRQACQNNDPHAALTNLVIWIGISRHAHETRSIEQFTREMGEHPLAEHIKVLHAARLADSTKWSGAALLDALIQSRGKLLSRLANQPREVRSRSET